MWYFAHGSKNPRINIFLHSSFINTSRNSAYNLSKFYIKRAAKQIY